jgi:beta-fructofuranosidase
MTEPDLPAAPGAWVPRYHITAERNWLNDPNGPVQHDGTWHVFHQANPLGSTWGLMVWGHLSSDDLVTWRRHPPALVPDPGTADQDGCWSGCTRIVDGRPAIYYTGIIGDDELGRTESICRAWGSGDLLTWTKDEANPLVPGQPEGWGGGYHRDPFLWRDEDGWHLLLGDGSQEADPAARHGRLLRWDSADATSWTYGGVMFEGEASSDGVDLGAHWECPALVRTGDADLILVSAQRPGGPSPLLYSIWYSGKLDGGTYDGTFGGLVDYGDVLYAVTAFVDESGRNVLWGWAQDPFPADHGAPSAVGALGLPREIVVEAGRAGFRPMPELEKLRQGQLEGDGETFTARPQMELTAEGPATWTLSDGADSVGIALDTEGLRVTVTAGGARRELTAPAPERLDLRVFVDGSLVEVFAGDRVALTTRAYPAGGSWATATCTTSGQGQVAAWALPDDAINEEVP